MHVALRRHLRLIAIAATVAAGAAGCSRNSAPPSATAEVVRGEYVDVVEIRGQVRPVKSVIVTAPMQAGDLQILSVVKNGTLITKGEVAIEFDGSVLQRTILDRTAELKQALAELDQLKARLNIGVGGNRMALLTTGYDVERATLDTVGPEDLVSKVDAQRAQLALADAQQRQRQAKLKDGADAVANTSGLVAQTKRIAKIQSDLARAELASKQLVVRAPASGMVNILNNPRNNAGLGNSTPYRPGDNTWAGAEIIELPDLSRVHVDARLDESDRGRLQPGQRGSVRIDAIADHDFQASVSEVSVLAKVDQSSWPATKNFVVKLAFLDPDPRLRPGMSAAARIVVGHLPDMLMVPTESVFIVDGRPAVYLFKGRGFVTVPVEIVRRGREQVALKAPLAPGDRVALTRPSATGTGAAK